MAQARKARKTENTGFSLKISDKLLNAARIASAADGSALGAWIKDFMKQGIGASDFETKRKIVEAGASAVYTRWHEIAGIEESDFLEGLEWVCEDPGAKSGKLQRELGLNPPADAKLKDFAIANGVADLIPQSESSEVGELVKLCRVYDDEGNLRSIQLLEDDKDQKAGDTWSGTISISARDAI